MDRKEILPVDEGCYTSLTGRDSFQLIRCNSLINRKEFLPVNGVVVSYLPEGFPSGHLGATTKSPQA
jgi:hypothetical protein